MSQKTEVEKLKEELLTERKNGASKVDAETLQKADDFCEDYKAFLNRAKTEREAVAAAVQLAEQAGFTPFDLQRQYQPGDKVYLVNREKAAVFAVIGQKRSREGVRIAVAHIDSPRVDLKPNPLYEANDLAFFKTHYYGGVRKYQWATIPLALHGVIVKADGSTVRVCIGEKPEDPVFCITDLLPHLAAKQNEKKLPEGITGENLNVLIASTPIEDKTVENRVKLNVLSMLNEAYGISERDFTRAEIEVVPAFCARDIGLDRAMIGAYGHDDRVDAYPALMAEIGAKNPAHTTVCILTDKEEVGSDGVTGMNSEYGFAFLRALCAMEGVDPDAAFAASKCISSDVTAAYDPSYAEAFEPNNGTYAGRGVAIYKYTGARGKSSTSDACAELVGYLTNLFDQNGVAWQIGEMGKIDLGGGGTIAKYVANRNIDTIDLGVPVLSMHSPFEVVSKLDVYMAFKAFEAFCANAE